MPRVYNDPPALNRPDHRQRTGNRPHATGKSNPRRMDCAGLGVLRDMKEKSIYAKHSGWDRPLVDRPEWKAARRRKKAEENAYSKFNKGPA